MCVQWICDLRRGTLMRSIECIPVCDRDRFVSATGPSEDGTPTCAIQAVRSVHGEVLTVAGRGGAGPSGLKETPLQGVQFCIAGMESRVFDRG